MLKLRIAPLLISLLAVCLHAGEPQTIQELVDLEEAELAKVDIARVNLICAQGLPGAEKLEIDRMLEMLTGGSFYIGSEIYRNMHQFHADPARYYDSQAYFKMAMLVTVMKQDMGVAYNPDRDPEKEASETFFKNPRDVFLHGFLTHDRKPLGTCSNLPVMCVAVGRRLGYPLKLVTTRSHVFARWDDGEERFNIEVTNGGMTMLTDEDYERWPHRLSAEDVDADQHLKSLTPREELALFLDLRSVCFHVHGRMKEAEEALGLAAQLDPDNKDYRQRLERFVNPLSKQ